MNDKARHGYAPASDFSGDWGDSLPQISGDKVGYKGGAPEETRNRSWGNKGGNEVWPSLTNPYIKQGGDYTMKGEKNVSKNHDTEGLTQWQSGDTWSSEGGSQNRAIQRRGRPERRHEPLLQPPCQERSQILQKK
jgi:hypothetical protein